jgi:hypothetical protein
VTQAPVPEAREPAAGPAPKPLTVNGLLLLDPHGYDPTHVDTVVVNDVGIGVIRRRGEAPRVLPWESVVAHAVEHWPGGVIPDWWVDPGEQHTDGPLPVPDGWAVDSSALLTAHHHLPHAEAGALISIQTRTGTYRFLRTGGDPVDLTARIGAFAVRHQGPAGLSTVTTVAPTRLRRGYVGGTGWSGVRPYLVVLLLVVIVAAVALILLQSAGTIHLPFLGGNAASFPRAGSGPGGVPA